MSLSVAKPSVSLEAGCDEMSCVSLRGKVNFPWSGAGVSQPQAEAGGQRQRHHPRTIHGSWALLSQLQPRAQQHPVSLLGTKTLSRWGRARRDLLS